MIGGINPNLLPLIWPGLGLYALHYRESSPGRRGCRHRSLYSALAFNQQRQLHNGSLQGILIFMHALKDIRKRIFGGGFDSIRGS
jgi:hypothetical protein